MSDQQNQRDAIIQEIVDTKFDGERDWAAFLPQTEDRDALLASADKLANSVREVAPSFGSKPVSSGAREFLQGAQQLTTNHGLTPGQVAFAKSMKLHTNFVDMKKL